MISSVQPISSELFAKFFEWLLIVFIAEDALQRVGARSNTPNKYCVVFNICVSATRHSICPRATDSCSGRFANFSFLQSLPRLTFQTTQGDIELQPRVGSDIDLEKIKKTFKDTLKYDFKQLQDPSCNEVLRELKRGKPPKVHDIT